MLNHGILRPLQQYGNRISGNWRRIAIDKLAMLPLRIGIECRIRLEAKAKHTS